MVSAPHFLLFSESQTKQHAASEWRFVLEAVDGMKRVAASAREETTSCDRAELLAVVRGLEALENPSRVTLVTKSRYVSHGFVRGLEEWRNKAWRWERFGRLVPIRNADLWQRIDRALCFHQVDCRTWRFDSIQSSRVESENSQAKTTNQQREMPKRRNRITRIDSAHMENASPEHQKSKKPKKNRISVGPITQTVSRQCQRLVPTQKLQRA